MTELAVWSVLYFLGAGLAVGGVFVLAGGGVACLVASLFALYLSHVVRTGMQSKRSANAR